MQGGLLDDPALLAAAATDAGLNPEALAAWAETDAVRADLEADASAARRPSAAARALGHKLGGPAAKRRYTAPSYVIDGFAIPGFQPVEVYEAAIANQAPYLSRRPSPVSVTELMQWAPEPLATAEAALIMQRDIDTVRAELARVARFVAAGADGYWTQAR